MPIKKGQKYEHFKNTKAFRKYQAYIHIHKIPHKHKKFVIIGNIKHAVKNTEGRIKHIYEKNKHIFKRLKF